MLRIMAESKAAVFIDNQHLKKQLIDKLGEGLHKFLLDYEALSKLLCEDVGVEMFRTYIYDCEMQSNERLLSKLNQISGFEVKKGTIQHNERGYRQKQVDILLALDMIKMSLRNRIEEIILITGDADFVPVVQFVKEQSVKVHLRTGFTYSRELANACDSAKEIDESFILEYGSNWRNRSKRKFLR